MMKKVWRLWAISLGSKAFEDNYEADMVALFRTAIVLVNFISCFVIIAAVIKHW